MAPRVTELINELVAAEWVEFTTISSHVVSRLRTEGSKMSEEKLRLIAFEQLSNLRSAGKIEKQGHQYRRVSNG